MLQSSPTTSASSGLDLVNVGHHIRHLLHKQITLLQYYLCRKIYSPVREKTFRGSYVSGLSPKTSKDLLPQPLFRSCALLAPFYWLVTAWTHPWSLQTLLLSRTQMDACHPGMDMHLPKDRREEPRSPTAQGCAGKVRVKHPPPSFRLRKNRIPGFVKIHELPEEELCTLKKTKTSQTKNPKYLPKNYTSMAFKRNAAHGGGSPSFCDFHATQEQVKQPFCTGPG